VEVKAGPKVEVEGLADDVNTPRSRYTVWSVNG
jgi:hypothetical protein